MNNIQQLIEQAKAVMTCPTCGRHYDSREISFKGCLDHTYVLQAMCSNAHPTVVTTWVTSFISATHNQATNPIDSDHIIALHRALKSFDGNFKALWSKER